MTVSIITAFSEISQNYDVVFCDVWGVIHNGKEQFPDATKALKEYRENGGKVILISNSPRPCDLIPPQLASMNIGNDIYDAIVTSGDATIMEARKHGTKALRLGPPKDDEFFRRIGVEYVEIQNAQFIVCTGPRDDLNESAESYRNELREMVSHNLPFICANPDKMVQHGEKIIPCGGALADIYEELGGKVIMAGKPFAPIYAMTRAKAYEVLEHVIEDDRILCIGDGLKTDVLGANNQRLDCLFIADGIHASELLGKYGLDEAKTVKFLRENGLVAKFAMDGLS